MPGFYKKAALVFFCLAVFTLMLLWFCLQRFFVSTALLPAHESRLPWKLQTMTDVGAGGGSRITVKDRVYSLDYEYRLTDDIIFPYAILVLNFASTEELASLVDLSSYTTVTFRVKCSAQNIPALHLHSYDEQVTDPEVFSTYRIAAKYFSCGPQWSDIAIDLQHLNVPLWWLEVYKQDVSDKNYWPEKTVALSFDNSNQGPVNSDVKVVISDLVLHGRNWAYIYLLIVILVLLWSGFSIWLFRFYTTTLIADVKAKLKKDRSIIAYQKLSIEPHKDEEKSRVLRFMATEYANPDMSLEYAIAELGINRTKINELLKHELGLTFTSYLNKLRLAEAARLLSQSNSASVADIAYSVGYNNVSYFNKLFKTGYGCTPKKFKAIYESKKAD